MSIQGFRARVRGFSLIELLVVIGVIAILLALLIATISRAWAQARFVKCKANLSAQLQAHQAYANDFRGAKPPLLRPSRLQVDFVSPDVQWGGEPIGHGLLIGKYLPSIEPLLDPSEAMEEDADRDRTGWEERELRTTVNSGSSYVYYWRRRPDFPPSSIAAFGAGLTYQFAARDGFNALILDINAEPEHDYKGAYENRKWINHPRIGRMNVACEDGSVKDIPVTDAMVKAPGGHEEEELWIAEVNRVLVGQKTPAASQ